MDSNLNSQLDQLSLGGSAKSFNCTSELPPLAPSFPPSDPSSLPRPISSSAPSITPISFISLPPELISEIFEAIPAHPSSERNSTLSYLCLVNHLFLELARPLLYREVFLNLNKDYDDFDSRYRKLVETLVDYPDCANLVRGIRLPTAEALDSDTVIVAYVLSHLKHLEWIRMSWNHSSIEDGGERLIKMISKHQPRLRSLTLPGIGLDHTTLNTMFSKLPQLESYTGSLPGPHKSEPLLPFPNLSCKLRKLVLLQPDQTCFQHLTRFSHSSLTSLGLSPTPESEFDLSQFPNLVNLRLQLGIEWSTRLERGSVAEAVNYTSSSLVRGIRRILVSARAVESFSISTEDDLLAADLRSHRLLDVLPPSLVHFSSFPVLLRPKSVNQSLLFKAIRSRSLPRLRQITVLPLGAGKDFEEIHHWQQVTAQEELIEFCGPYGIKIERIGIIGQWYHQGYGLEPLQEDSTTDHEEEQSDLDSYEEQENSWDEESDDSNEAYETDDGSDE